MLLLGVVQAQASGAGPLVETDFDLLQTEILTGTQTSVTFSDLGDYATDYQHLQIRMTARTTLNNGGAGQGLFMRLNGDTGSNYRSHNLFGNGSSVISNTGATTSYMSLYRVADNQSPANGFGALVIDILDPFETSKNSTIRALGGNTASTSYIWMQSGAWFNTASVSTILIQPEEGASLVEYSRFSLYGLKASV
jgi:hypothetical protein